MTFTSRVGERLKEQRQKLKLSQAEIAERVGITREHWGRCERGVAVPGGEVLAALLALGADIVYVLGGAPSGNLGGTGEAVSADEEELLQLFRAAPLAVKAAAIGALSSARARKEQSQSAAVRDMVNHGAGGVQVAGHGKVSIRKG